MTNNLDGENFIDIRDVYYKMKNEEVVGGAKDRNPIITIICSPAASGIAPPPNALIDINIQSDNPRTVDQGTERITKNPQQVHVVPTIPVQPHQNVNNHFDQQLI